MKLKQTSSSKTSTTVKLVPSTAINPFGTMYFGTMYFSNSFSTLTFTHNVTLHEMSAHSSNRSHRPVEIHLQSCFQFGERSFRSVSGAKPTVKSEVSVSNSVTVRHVPLTAMLSPRLTPSRTVVALTFKSKPPSGDAPICLTVPISSTRPVKRHWTEAALVRRLIGLRVE
ncbi:unnamed protein product [Lathyrus sativus]|nr:unnamed protein product [Lathyrus sativus]